MIKKLMATGIAAFMGISLGICGAANAWLFDATANVDTNSDNQYNSNNKYDETNEQGSRNKVDGNYLSATSTRLNRNSNNRYDRSTKDYSDHNSHNRTNLDYDYDYDSTYTDSRNLSSTDASDRSLNNSLNTDNSVNNSTNDSHDYILTDTTGGDKRVDSNNYTIAGNVRNTNQGDFNQVYNGTDFRSGVRGSGNTIDTSSVNITTFGDSITKGRK